MAVFRTREQSVLLFLIGLFVAVSIPWQAFSTDAAGHTLSQPLTVTIASLGIASGLFIMTRLARCGVYAYESGVRLVNPFSGRFIPWAEISSFSLRHWTVFPAMGHVEVLGGGDYHIWGIQPPNPLFRRSDGRAAQQVKELNRLARVFGSRSQVGNRRH